MTDPTPPTRAIHFEEITVRFYRQLYYSNEQVYQLEVRQSPGPLPGGAFQADLEAQLERFGQIFNQRILENRFFYRYQAPSAEPETLRQLAELGGQLYTLLPEPFRLAWPRLLQNVFDRGRGVRLIIEARAGDKAERLLSLPWELLFFQETGVYPARSPRVVIVRRLLEAIRRSPITLAPPFEVVHVIAHAADGPEKYRLDPQLRQIEQAAIRRSVAPEHYHPVTDPGSVAQMLAVVREQGGQIIHFLGHGEFFEAGTDAPAETGRSYLRFVDEVGGSQWVSGEQLQQLLSFSPAVQVVVLNACHGGAIAPANVALELVYSGCPTWWPFRAIFCRKPPGISAGPFTPNSNAAPMLLTPWRSGGPKLRRNCPPRLIGACRCCIPTSGCRSHRCRLKWPKPAGIGPVCPKPARWRPW